TSVQEHRLTEYPANFGQILLGIVQLSNVDSFQSAGNHADRDVSVVTVSQGAHSSADPVQDKVHGHMSVVDRDHQIGCVRSSRTHQVPELLIYDVLARELLQSLADYQAYPAQLAMPVCVGLT